MAAASAAAQTTVSLESSDDNGVVPEIVEGDWKPERLVVLEFETETNARDFLADPDSKELFKLRHSSTDSKLIYAASGE